MNPISRASDQLLIDFQQRKIMTLDELKCLLHTQCRRTVMRKLTPLGYISSYSHSGRYYSLQRLASYSQYGIWSYQSALFSQYGTLKHTLVALIDQSPQGYTAAELKHIVQVKVADALLALVTTKMILREKVSGGYTYYTKQPNLHKKHVFTRQGAMRSPDDAGSPDPPADEVQEAFLLFFSTLNEKQRRLYAGYESLKRGHGGDTRMAELLELDPKTVAKGRHELLEGTVNLDSIRAPGGGRTPIKKNATGA